MALLKKVKHLLATERKIHFGNNLNWGVAVKNLNLEYRIKGSTLMETMVATVLIVVIFMVSSMIMNNLLMNNIKQNTELAEERLNALAYQLKNEEFKLPYYEDFESWEISVFEEKQGQNSIVTLEAENTVTKTIVTNYRTSED